MAGNEPMGMSLDVARHMRAGGEEPLSAMRRHKLPKGSGGHYLCERCNNLTGAWYVRDYSDWAWQGERLRVSVGDTNSLALPFRIFPGRVFKQILAIFACTCGERMFEVHPLLRTLVLNKDSKGRPDQLRLFTYMVHPESHFSRQSGIVGMFDGNRSHTFAEFAYRPFGYLLVFGGRPSPDEGLFDITFFGDSGYNDYRELHLPIPVRPVESYLPADFRTKKEWVDATGGYGVGKRP